MEGRTGAERVKHVVAADKGRGGSSRRDERRSKSSTHAGFEGTRIDDDRRKKGRTKCKQDELERALFLLNGRNNVHSKVHANRHFKFQSLRRTANGRGTSCS